MKDSKNILALASLCLGPKSSVWEKRVHERISLEEVGERKNESL